MSIKSSTPGLNVVEYSYMSNRLNPNVVGLLDLVELAITSEQFDEIVEFIQIHRHFLNTEIELLKGIEALLDAKITEHNNNQNHPDNDDHKFN